MSTPAAPDDTTADDGGRGAQPIRYWGAFEEDGTPIGLFRMLEDATTHSIERLNPDGSWIDDPDLIDFLQEPEVKPVEAAEASQIRDVLAAGETQDTQVPEDVAGEATAPAP